jgi:type II secretory pathway component PulJ
MTPSLRLPSRRKAFTLLEATVVCLLMVLLSMLLSTIWSGMGRPLADTVARARVTQEATLARASFARDWAGSLPNSIGARSEGRLVGRQVVGGSELRLCFDGGSCNGNADWATPDAVIAYQVQSNRLTRVDQNSLETVTVANDVQSMTVTDLLDAVQIDLTIEYREVARTYTFIARDP